MVLVVSVSAGEERVRCVGESLRGSDYIRVVVAGSAEDAEEHSRGGEKVKAEYSCSSA